MKRSNVVVEYGRDGDVHVARAMKAIARRFRIEQRTVFVLCEELPAEHARSSFFDGVAIGGETWTKNREELFIADTREGAEAGMRRLCEQEPYW